MLQIRVSDRLVCGLFILNIEPHKCCKSAYQTGWYADYSFVMLYTELYTSCTSAYQTRWYADYSFVMLYIELYTCCKSAYQTGWYADYSFIHLSCCISNCTNVANPHIRLVGMRTIHIAYLTVQMLQVHVSDRLIYGLFILHIELCKCCKSAYQTGWYADYSFVTLHIKLN
jgi:hypothetical protein